MKPFSIITSLFIIAFIIVSINFTVKRGPELKKLDVGFSNAELLLTIYPKTFARDITQVDKLSQDGKMIGYIKEGDMWLYDLNEEKEIKLEESDQFDWVTGFEWQGNSSMIKLTGYNDGQISSKIVSRDDKKLEIELPESYLDVTLLDKQFYAFKYWDQEKDEGGVYLKKPATEDPVLILPEIYPISMALSQDARLLAFLYNHEPSNLTLGIYNIEDDERHSLAENLDGSERSRISFSSDGQYILISLAGDQSLDLAEKHKPTNDRDFNIYAVEISSGAMTILTPEEGDDLLIGVDGDRAYWNIIKPMVKTVMISMDDGKITPLISQQSFMPEWHPSGKEIAVIYGDWRLADFPLNWDLGSFKVNKKGEVTQDLTPLVSGYHEDFGPSWSPDGSKIVYQSHRSEKPVMYYDSEESTDDIYMQSPGEGDEVRLTDFCREAWKPEFSPDGKKIVFCASGKDRLIMRPYIILLDGENKASEVREISIDAIEDPVWSATWSPEGDLLALEVSDGSINKSIWLVAPDGSDPVELTQFESLTLVSGLDFTPDGKYIIFSAFKSGRHQIFKVSVDGGEPERITVSPYDIVFPAISPDGKKIAATVYRNSKQIWGADITLR